MNSPDARKRKEQLRFTVLSLLSENGKPVNFLEIGFSASPQVLRNMAALGFIRISVEVTDSGRRYLVNERLRRKRTAVKVAQEKRIAGAVFGNPAWSQKEG
jgi:hypothetical protein